jgi:hypothetical protein
MKFFATLTPQQWMIVAACVAGFVALSWWAIQDAFRRDFASTNEKLFWIQLSVLVPFIGGLAYLFFGKKRGSKT